MKAILEYIIEKVKGYFNSCLVLLLISSSIVSCDSIEVEGPNYQLSSETVFTDASTAEATIIGIYISMMQAGGFVSGGQQSITSLAGLSADELVNHSQFPEQGQFYSNELLPTNSWLQLYLWDEGYKYIYQANAIIESLSNSDELPEETRSELLAEAYFIRAFSYFQLVNLFGEIPIIVSTDYEENRLPVRSPVSEVYDLIESDFLLAAEDLPLDYSFAGGERIRPTKWAAEAMLAKIYLYMESWEDAETHASNVIAQNSLYEIPQDLNQVFLANSREAIWQLQPVLPNQNTMEGLNYLLLFTPFNVSLYEEVVNDFDQTDLRRLNWVDSLVTETNTYYFPTKYKVKFGNPVIEYSMVLRLSEVYLIRAEAKIEQGKINEGQDDINILRQRAGVDELELSDQTSLLEAVLKERRLELFTEGGNRWFDLKRTNKADEVLSPIKSGWNNTDVLYPIPENELNRNPNLSQNPGY